MDSWESIRHLARQKHSELVQESEDYSAEDLLSIAEDLTQIARKPVSAGDPLLFGAEAMLDPDANTIWFNNEVEPELSAFYQAHEYAHFWIDGAHASCSADDLDYEAAETQLPIGINRVEGYGPQERRELQANVFAREFLLPFNKLIKWFSDDNLDAATIAARSGVFEGMVNHQLAYALFYPGAGQAPKIQEGGEAKATKKDLDPSQQTAASISKGPLLLEAGPGTGKTTTLMGRIEYILQELHVEPSAILALTFSNKAAEEMRARVAQVSPDAAPHIWMGTFHAYGLELLRKFGTKLGLPAKPNVIDPAAALFLLERELSSLDLNHYKNLYEPALPIRDILGAISRAKDELVTPQHYKELAEQMLEEANSDEDVEAGEKALEVAQVYHHYERVLGDTGTIDFGDLIFKSVSLLQAHHDVRDQIRAQYDHILVDEFQDINYASGIFLQEIAGEGEGLWVVGDVRQSIYRFRGAAPRNVVLFTEQYPGAKKLSLKRNYRSQRKIIDTFEAFAPQMQATGNDDFNGWESARTDEDGQVLMEIGESLEAEGQGLAQDILRQQDAGIQFRDQAILCRTHTQLARIAEILERHDVPVLYLGKFFERDEIRDLLALISLACEGNGFGLIRVAHFPEYQIPLPDVLRLLMLADEQDIAFPSALSLAEEAIELTDEGKAGLLLLRSHLEDISFGTSAWGFLSKYLFTRSQYLRSYINDDSVPGQQRKLAINQLLAFIYSSRETPEDVIDDPKRWLLDTIRRLEIFGETKQLRQLPESAASIDAVRLLTVHASKGLEFRAVYLPYLGRRYFPVSRQYQPCPPPIGMLPDDFSDWHDEEEECLFFVAMSRAKDVLCFSRANTYGTQTSNPSQFLEPIAHLLPNSIDGEATWKAGGEITPQVEVEGSRDFEVGELDLYIRCPNKYYYTYVIDLAGKSKDSAYVQFHRCVYDVWYWMNEVKLQGQPTSEPAALKRLHELWEEHGPVGHPFEPYYRQNAEVMVQLAIKIKSSENTPVERPTWSIPLKPGRVSLQPNHIEAKPDGTNLVQRLRTGRISSSEMDKNIYALYQVGASDNLDDGSDVQVVSLSTNEVKPLAMSDRKVQTRLRKYEQAMAGIISEDFTPAPNDRECPRCPYFFVCPKPET